MEIKEADGILKSLQEPEAWEPQITEKTFEALDMAIRALEREDDKSRFFTLEYDFQYSIKVDRDTGVMYAVSNGNNNAGTFTPLINADGKPLIYKQIIKESDLVKMGVIEPGEIKAGKIKTIEQLEKLLKEAESEPPITEGSVLEDLLVPVGLVKEIISEQPVATDTNVGNNSEIPNSSNAVSRQAAIDLVRDVCDAVMSGCESWYDPETKDEVYKDIREVDAILKCNKEVRIALQNMPSAQPETAKRIVGKSRDGMTLWYQCDMCNEPVDEQDNYCRGCGRMLIDG